MECQCAAFYIKHMAADTALGNITWLPTGKNASMYPVYMKEKMYIALVYRPFPYNVFVCFLEGQVHKKKSNC